MAAPRRTPSPRQGSRPQSGDATGKEKARQMAAAAPAIKQAALATSLINVPVEDEIEVMDYSQGAGESVREIDPSEFMGMVDDDLTEGDPDDDYNEPEVDDGRAYSDGRVTGFEDPEEVVLDEPQPKHGRPGQRRGAVQEAEQIAAVAVAEKPLKWMRVNEDLDNVTIGKDPETGDLMHYTFRVAGRYRVPRHVYEHLDRIGYVRH